MTPSVASANGQRVDAVFPRGIKSFGQEPGARHSHQLVDAEAAFLAYELIDPGQPLWAVRGSVSAFDSHKN